MHLALSLSPQWFLDMAWMMDRRDDRIASSRQYRSACGGGGTSFADPNDNSGITSYNKLVGDLRGWDIRDAMILCTTFLARLRCVAVATNAARGVKPKLRDDRSRNWLEFRWGLRSRSGPDEVGIRCFIRSTQHYPTVRSRSEPGPRIEGGRRRDRAGR